MVIEGHDLTVQSDLGWKIGAASVIFAAGRDGEIPFGQHLGLEAADLRPDPGLTALLPDLGDVISTVHLDATVTLSAALDRHVAETKPTVKDLILRDFHVIWGTLDLTASGQLAAGTDGRATGQIDFSVTDWKQIPALVVALGLVRPEMGKSLTNGLEVMAKSGEDPEVLKLALTFADGWVNLGPLPLGTGPDA